MGERGIHSLLMSDRASYMDIDLTTHPYMRIWIWPSVQENLDLASRTCDHRPLTLGLGEAIYPWKWVGKQGEGGGSAKGQDPGQGRNQGRAGPRAGHWAGRARAGHYWAERQRPRAGQRASHRSRHMSSINNSMKAKWEGPPTHVLRRAPRGPAYAGEGPPHTLLTRPPPPTLTSSTPPVWRCKGCRLRRQSNIPV